MEPAIHDVRRAVSEQENAGLIEQVEAWAAANGTGRSESIRRLVELGLKARK
jgi:hypothetical protein